MHTEGSTQGAVVRVWSLQNLLPSSLASHSSRSSSSTYNRGARYAVAMPPHAEREAGQAHTSARAGRLAGKRSCA
jgi:hypothetical protein